MEKTPIFKALKIPSQNLEDMIQGQSIIALTQVFITPGYQFALYPDQTNFDSDSILINFWARCEFCQIIDDPSSFDTLALLIMRSSEELNDIFERKGAVFLAYLKVYSLANSIELPANQNNQFINLLETVYVSDDSPVLSDHIFARHREQIEKMGISGEPELQNLQLDVRQLAVTIPDAKLLDKQLKVFLGLAESSPTNLPDWIKNREIVTLGDRSFEQDQGKSNYQAGTDFENIVKQSLEFLGFKIDEIHKGGAGGLDLFCSNPYYLVGECKAGKKIPDVTVEQLDRIAKRHLKERYLSAYRLIIGSGEPTKNLKESAIQSIISIMKTMTLQKLVELKAKYDGAINLFELKEYLQAGQIDTVIDEYIQKVESRIRLRSHIVNLIKNHREDTVKVETIFSAYISYLDSIPSKLCPDPDSSPPSLPLPKREDLHEILIELSSPLAGYLGRQKGNDWESDRFYFLRDLPI